jgi:non-structural maintenance of chromosomes element 4
MAKDQPARLWLETFLSRWGRLVFIFSLLQPSVQMSAEKAGDDPGLNSSVAPECSIHHRYLDLLQEIRVSKDEILENRSKLESLIETSNILFKKINTSSELRLDAKVNALSTRMSHTRMERDMSESGMTSKRFIAYLEKGLLEEFYEYAFSCYWGMVFLDQLVLRTEEGEQGKRAPPQRRQLNVAEAEIPRPVSAVGEDTDLFEIVSQIRCLASERGECDYFELVIDPASFSKTVENMFYLSFAIRSGIVSLVSREDALVICSGTTAGEDSGHLVLEMTYEEYRAIIERMGGREALLKRRRSEG